MENMWIYPAVVTALAACMFLWLVYSAEGEDTMGLPYAAGVAVIVSAGSWLLYGLIYLVRWAFG